MTTVITRTLTDPATGKVVRTETYSSRYVAWNDRFSRGTKGKPKATATPARCLLPRPFRPPCRRRNCCDPPGDPC